MLNHPHMSFNNLMRRRASRPAIQATIAETNRVCAYDGGDELDFGSEGQSIADLEDVRVLNNPAGNVISESSKVTANNTEVRSEELAILSTSSSGSGSVAQSFNQQFFSPIVPENSQRIDEWCMNSELHELTEANMSLSPSATCSRVQDIVSSWGMDHEEIPRETLRRKRAGSGVKPGNYTSDLLRALSDEQIIIVKQLTKELLPLLRNSRRTHSVFTNRYRDIPSVFAQRDLILACSLRYNDSDCDIVAPSQLSESLATVSLDDTRSSSSLTSISRLGWTLVPRLTENELR